MEIEDQLGDGRYVSTATAYNGERLDRNKRTMIDNFQSGLARFTKLPANYDSTGKSEIKKTNF